ncbi:SsgA family sporulation/cell division regulator [Streptomyces pluripotens]|uniref:SsgA family sporulation/cell division regulator n=1 Tax=Streptomyces pluripotens TaxID=1355015 RepID=A0A221P6D8_9ACTN|nr:MULTISPECIES: SsgA family sporulation/cell division regulator [Streptomyces]ARP73580.1 SsgA family sporulation/cell division regulator [Streptomyces pluripotens]ASN27829.1 SsgA family sporulation/cell division regulator [Streptomyces pluripotens]KIE26771.1 SsgD protein [Streptomyces sp. MUSC 125]MCH0557231.1 SsgA family sporulation/cell division regulator [Streptomyces sp. MUM 16J]
MDITIEHLARARLITTEDREIPVSATLRYTTCDPLAVYVDFPAEAALDGEEVTWTFARSLLDQGLRAPAGHGDVQIWPCGRTRTVVEFHSPYGLALLQFQASALRRFLVCTYGVVGSGQEDMAAVVERGLSALFGGV